MYGVIYEAINKLNNKRYIGQTIQNLDKRIQHHKIISRNNNRAFYKAIRKYGWDNFEWKTIDYADNQKDLDSKETFWIVFFNTYKQNGYNMTTGGQTEKEYASKKYKCNKVSYKNKTVNHRKILVYDKGGNHVKTITDIYKFAKYFNIDTHSILSVLNGKKNSIGGFIFFYEDDFTEEKLKHNIKQLRNYHEFTIYDTHQKKFLGVWTNLTRCNEDTGITRRAMEKQLYNEVKTKPRKFVIKYISDCTDDELIQIKNVS